MIMEWKSVDTKDSNEVGPLAVVKAMLNCLLRGMILLGKISWWNLTRLPWWIGWTNLRLDLENSMIYSSMLLVFLMFRAICSPAIPFKKQASWLIPLQNKGVNRREELLAWIWDFWRGWCGGEFIFERLDNLKCYDGCQNFICGIFTGGFSNGIYLRFLINDSDKCLLQIQIQIPMSWLSSVVCCSSAPAD